MKPAAIYARFSTELQNEKSTEDQIALCRTHAARHQLNIVATFEDKARSGASVFGRDGLMQLISQWTGDGRRTRAKAGASRTSWPTRQLAKKWRSE
jgi:Resolvase, N terminal domain